MSETAKRPRRLFSGIQPTGTLHIGNWLGAIQNWVRLIEETDATFCVVDYHAMTVDYDPADMAPRIRAMATELIACGVDPERCTLYVQSQVPEHTELAWILMCVTPIAELERMTQFKDKAAQHKKNVNAGLFSYPALQAADILLHLAEVVPVGEDQVQHLELSRMLARKFNRRFGRILPEPRPIVGAGARIMGLDADNKMSKSLGNQVDLCAPTEEITRMVTRAVSDPQRIRRDDPGRPEVCNIYSLHGHFTPEAEREAIAVACRAGTIGCFDCKKTLAGGIDAAVAPIRDRAAELREQPGAVDDLLAHGAAKARARARETIDRVRDACGIAGPFGRGAGA